MLAVQDLRQNNESFSAPGFSLVKGIGARYPSFWELWAVAFSAVHAGPIQYLPSEKWSKTSNGKIVSYAILASFFLCMYFSEFNWTSRHWGVVAVFSQESDHADSRF